MEYANEVESIAMTKGIDWITLKLTSRTKYVTTATIPLTDEGFELYKLFGQLDDDDDDEIEYHLINLYDKAMNSMSLDALGEMCPNLKTLSIDNDIRWSVESPSSFSNLEEMKVNDLTPELYEFARRLPKLKSLTCRNAKGVAIFDNAFEIRVE